MKLGFNTNSLMATGKMDLLSIADWAQENGFEMLEVGPSVPLEEEKFEKVLSAGKVGISNLLYCRNYLGREAEFHRDQLYKRIDFAAKMGIKMVVTSTGIDREWDDKTDTNECDRIRRRPIRSMDAIQAFFTEVLEYAEKKDIDLAFELCPLMGNTAISPYLLHELFTRLPSDRLGVAFDPSHLVWEMIDAYDFVYEFKDKIRLVHGKDAEILPDVLRTHGILSDFDWWRYRLPGLGTLNWNKLVSRLQEVDYDGVISIEHEDPVWEGSEEKVKKGILIGRNTMLKALNMDRM